jgi:hypothetical protein
MGLGSGIRAPGSAKKNLFRIPDSGPGVKKAPDPGSGSATLIYGIPEGTYACLNTLSLQRAL